MKCHFLSECNLLCVSVNTHCHAQVNFKFISKIIVTGFHTFVVVCAIHTIVSCLLQEWISSIDWGSQLKAAPALSTRGPAQLYPHTPLLLRLDTGCHSTQTPSMKPRRAACSHRRSARSFLLWLALAPGELTMLFYSASKTAGTDCGLASSCCRAE